MVILCNGCAYYGRAIIGRRPRPSKKKVLLCPSCLGAVDEDSKTFA